MTTMPADTDAIRAALAAMRERVEAATRGEWVAMYGNVLLPDDAGTLAFPVHGDEAEIDPENAAFIAHARQDVPALLSVAEAAAGLVDTGDGDPWWMVAGICRYECVGCGGQSPMRDDEPNVSDRVAHEPSCPALSIDRALAALAAGDPNPTP